MNRFVKLMLCVMALCLVFTLYACGGNTAGDQGESTADTTISNTQDTTETTVDDGKVTYTVKVVDEGGNPIAGAMVQLCLESCIPGKTNEEGVATYTVAEADYKVSFISIPAGYTADQTDYYFAAGAYELTITLKAVA